MREIRSYGSVGERGGNEPLYPEIVPGSRFQIPGRVFKCSSVQLFKEMFLVPGSRLQVKDAVGFWLLAIGIVTGSILQEFSAP